MNEKLTQQFINVLTSMMKSLKRDLKLERVHPCTFPQMELLQLLTRHSSLTCSQVAFFLGVTPPTVTRLVDGLVDRGWVERITPPDDRRSLVLRLTTEGEETARLRQERTQEIISEILGSLPEEDKHQLSLILEALQRILTDRAERSGEKNRRLDVDH